MWRTSLIPILALTLAATAVAQFEEPLAGDEPILDLQFEGLVEVSEVLLDVLATDLEGEFVPGLGKDDFLVEENGEPVKLTGVSYYTTRYGYGEGLDETPASRYFILFFHEQWRQSFRGGELRDQQLLAGRQSRRWLRDEMRPSDWVAVVGYGLKLRLYQDFTQDRDALRRAVRRASEGRPPGKAQLRRPSERRREVPVLGRMPKGAELRRETTTVYDALAVVGRACAKVAGRKNLLLFTIGFGKDRRAGEAEPDPLYYPNLETVLNDHNIAVYPIDLAPGDREPRQTEFLVQLAEDTGGAYQEGSYGFLDPLRDISGDNYAYYVLSYQSAHPAGQIGYQRVEVRARNEGVFVRSRKGYRYGL